VTFGHLKEISSMPTMEAILERQFGYIGARARLERWAAPAGPRWVGKIVGRKYVKTRWEPPKPVSSVDIRRDRRGEYFLLTLPDSASSTVLNTDHRRRHLLLLVNHDGEKSRYLCGHDERHWFAAAIPEDEPGVVDVETALRALMPAWVRNRLDRLRSRQRHRRRNPSYVRQGEWFFVPTPDLRPASITVRRREPLWRGRGKSHVMEFAHERGGTVVYRRRGSDEELTQTDFDALPQAVRSDPTWHQFRRGMDLYAMGRITHPDHATVVLHGWHEVFVNTEWRAKARQHLRFLD
jgi:hypothetical protein